MFKFRHTLPRAAMKRYMDRVAEEGCLVHRTPAELHHVMAMPEKTHRKDPRSVVPLCPDCHRGSLGVHGLGSERAFNELYGIDLAEEARRLWRGAFGMSGQTVILAGEMQRHRAKQLIDRAPPRAVVNIREATRTNEQSAKMWAMLSDIARAKPQGRVLPTEIWKSLFMAQCGHKMRFEPDLDGEGVVAIGFRSSRLTKAEMSDLIECIAAYGAQHGVEWSE